MRSLPHALRSFAGLLCFGHLALAAAQEQLTPEAYDRLKQRDAVPAHVRLEPGRPPQVKPATGERENGASCSCWVIPDSSYTLASEEADDVLNVVAHLPFSFNFYGELFDSLYVNMNGNVSFGQPYIWYPGGSFANDFPFSPEKVLAPFYGDVDIRDTTDTVPTSYLHGRLLYKVTPHAFYLNWDDVGYYHYHDSLRNSFQLIITDGTDPVVPDGGNVSFCYKDMQWTTGDASDGVNGFGGVSATIGANRGNAIEYAQVGRFGEDNSDFPGPYDEVNGVHWLDSMHFYLNTANALGVHPIFGSPFGCDSLVIPVGDATTYRIECIAGMVAEEVSCTSACPTIAAYQQVPTTADDHAPVLFSFDPTAAEIGDHDVVFTAENDDGTPLTSIYTLHVRVVDPLALGSASPGVQAGPTLFPDPAMDRCVLNWGGTQAPRSVSVFTMDGRLARRFTPNAGASLLDMDLTGLSAGLHRVVLAFGTTVRTLPLVITGTR